MAIRVRVAVNGSSNVQGDLVDGPIVSMPGQRDG